MISPSFPRPARFAFVALQRVAVCILIPCMNNGGGRALFKSNWLTTLHFCSLQFVRNGLNLRRESLIFFSTSLYTTLISCVTIGIYDDRLDDSSSSYIPRDSSLDLRICTLWTMERRRTGRVFRTVRRMAIESIRSSRRNPFDSSNESREDAEVHPR